jgi:hypothetical protein
MYKSIEDRFTNVKSELILGLKYRPLIRKCWARAAGFQNKNINLLETEHPKFHPSSSNVFISYFHETERETRISSIRHVVVLPNT